MDLSNLSLEELDEKLQEARDAAAARPELAYMLQAHIDNCEREKARRFAETLGGCFTLRDELKTLADTDTIVCRCEDVSYGKLKDYDSWRGAKLQTRCGMGPCQGRVCGGSASFLFGWENESVRPPIFPTRLENLSSDEHDDPDEILLA